MKKSYCIKYKRYRKFKNPEILFYKSLFISIICGKCGSKHIIIFKGDKWIKVLKILGLIKNI